MGEVYRAKDTRLGREVALKVLPARLTTNTGARERFERESKAVAALSHPNILALYDVGLEGGLAFAVTELLEGQTLREMLQPGSAPDPQGARLRGPGREGLVAAHEKGIVHRDLKPENLFVTRTATSRSSTSVSRSSRSPSPTNPPPPASRTKGDRAGPVLGTVGYMSPEQARGQPADARSDIFASARSSTRCSRARGRFTGTRARHAVGDPQGRAARSRDHEPARPSGLERLVRHCLEKDPAMRFQTARDLVFDLETLSSDSVSGSLGMAPPPARAPLRARVADVPSGGARDRGSSRWRVGPRFARAGPGLGPAAADLPAPDVAAGRRDQARPVARRRDRRLRQHRFGEQGHLDPARGKRQGDQPHG